MLIKIKKPLFFSIILFITLYLILGLLEYFSGSVYGLNNYIFHIFWIGVIIIFILFNRNFLSDLKSIKQAEKEQTINNIRKIFKIGLISFFVAIIIFLLSSSVIIMSSKTGQILDESTNNPLEGVYLARTTNIKIPCFECDGERIIRTELTKTDKEGKYYFPLFIKFKSPLNSFYRELLYVNVDTNLQQKDLSHETKIVGEGFHGLRGAIFGSKSYDAFGHTWEPFNNEITIILKQK